MIMAMGLVIAAATLFASPAGQSITSLFAPSCAGIDVTVLRRSLQGDVLVPGEPGYAAATQQWSKTFTRRPCVVVRCNTTADVQLGMAFARAHALPLSARSGGHNYMGWAVLDGSVLLDLKRIGHIRVAADKKTVEVGPGAFSDDVVRTLSLEHQLQTSTGGCPTVALGGFLLGGGWSSSAWEQGARWDDASE